MLHLYVITEASGRQHRVVADRVRYVPDCDGALTVFFRGDGVPDRQIRLGPDGAKAMIHLEGLPADVAAAIAPVAS